MSAPAMLLDRLGTLRPEDRAWILEQLSARERAALMDLAVDDSSKPAVIVEQPKSALQLDGASDDLLRLRAASAQNVAVALRGEPAWIIATLLALEPWAWAEELLEILPMQRAEVMQLGARPLVIGRGTRDLIVKECVRRLGAISESQHSKLRRVLEQFSSMLVKRRLAARS